MVLKYQIEVDVEVTWFRVFESGHLVLNSRDYLGNFYELTLGVL